MEIYYGTANDSRTAPQNRFDTDLGVHVKSWGAAPSASANGGSSQSSPCSALPARGSGLLRCRVPVERAFAPLPPAFATWQPFRPSGRKGLLLLGFLKWHARVCGALYGSWALPAPLFMELRRQKKSRRPTGRSRPVRTPRCLRHGGTMTIRLGGSAPTRCQHQHHNHGYQKFNHQLHHGTNRFIEPPPPPLRGLLLSGRALQVFLSKASSRVLIDDFAGLRLVFPTFGAFAFRPEVKPERVCVVTGSRVVTASFGRRGVLLLPSDATSDAVGV